MNRQESSRLKRLLGAISDQQRVDWSAEPAASPRLSRTLEAIRMLEGVVAAYQTFPGAPEQTPASGPAQIRRPRAPGASKSAAQAARRRNTPGTRPKAAHVTSRRKRATDTRPVPRARTQPRLEALGRWGPLNLLEKIGEGSFGEVFRAYDPGLEIEVALKLRHQASGHASREDQILEEARRLARVRHPNVLIVHGVARHRGRGGMWTELLSGQTLEELLSARGPLGAAEAASIGIHVCRALGALHAAGLVHRDVKTANVMRERGGRIVLRDFGAVRETDASGRVDTREAPIGTPLVMAPELLRGEPASPASDLYGLGALLYRMLSGSFPIAARTLDELRSAHAAGRKPRALDPRPGLDRSLVLAVERALEPEPGNRHTSAGAFERRLAECVSVPHRGQKARARAGVDQASEIVPTNLPSPGTSFVGRERELRECAELLAKERLLTLTGFGGCGKTRLAIGVAEELRAKFPDGVWFVDLATLVDSSQVPQALASVLDVRERPGATLRTCLEDELRAMKTLIVLDNCEHVLQGSSDLARSIVDGCEGVHVCATSREALGVESEQIYPVPPLPLPRNPEKAPAERTGEAESVRLFVERARRVRHDFKLTDRNAASVAAICCRLEGIPLAIELAAAKTRLLMPEEIVERIGGRDGLLSRDGSGGVPRHQTLRAAFQWSFDLLTEAERALLATLTSFVGTWRLEDAVALHGGDEAEVLRTLTRLVGKSLVSVDHGHRFATCYRLLAPVSELTEELSDPRRMHALRERHADYFLTRAETIEAGLAGAEPARWLEFVESEHGNLLAAIQRASSRVPRDRRAHRRNADAVLALAAAMWRYWYLRGHFTLGRAVLSRAIEAVGREAGAGVRAKAVWASGYLAILQGDAGTARPLFEQSLELFRTASDARGIARAYGGLGGVAVDRGDYAAARLQYEQMLSVLRSAGSAGELATALNNVGAVTWRLGNYERAAALHEEGLQQSRLAGHHESLILNLANLAWIAVRRGRLEETRRWLSEVMPSILELGARHRAAEAFEITAEALGLGGAWAKAVKVASRADALREEVEAPPETIWREAQDRFRAQALQTLGRDRYDAAWEAGRDLAFEQAAAQAIRWLSELPSEAKVS